LDFDDDEDGDNDEYYEEDPDKNLLPLERFNKSIANLVGPNLLESNLFAVEEPSTTLKAGNLKKPTNIDTKKSSLKKEKKPTEKKKNTFKIKTKSTNVLRVKKLPSALTFANIPNNLL
jgi:hypothetical protein